MKLPGSVRETPWDRRAFGFDTYEVITLDSVAEAFVNCTPGHFTIKVDPLADTRKVNECGFYYCDTLLVPFATRETYCARKEARAAISEVTLGQLIPMCRGVFRHGRYHRDPNITTELADRRYVQWVSEMHARGDVFGLTWEGRLAAFFGCSKGHVQLHAVADDFRGKGIAKHLWSVGIEELFGRGHAEVTSSVSAANLAVVNLYASLGFRFRDATDSYHKWNP